MKIRANIRVNGIVQGVGFRPFIHKQITNYNLCGWIRNTSVGAEIELEGEEEDVDTFAAEIWTKCPKLALIASVDVNKLDTLNNYPDFKIIKSEGSEIKNTLISPDVCICDECLEEMFTPGRRFRYPFINCTNCGPRFTIIRDVPYDRKQTSMAPFKMCPDCYSEYTTITDRRYHAEPTGCNDCGPKLWFADKDGKIICDETAITPKLLEAEEEAVSSGEGYASDPVYAARKYLLEGKIIAVKGLGGYHLAGRIDDAEIARTLRARKHRDEKPFAIMCKDVTAVRRYCIVSEDEEKVLTDFRRPIVLLRKNPDCDIDLSAISENGYIGVMLPYTPVHYMLFERDLDALIMTSANLSDTPIIYKDDEATQKLHGIADGFLANNREIHVRCDDSLVYVYDGDRYPVRRSRGFVPYPIIIGGEALCEGDKLPQILACGAEQKASFCLSKGNYVFASQHIGDMKNIETYENYQGQIEHFKRLFDIHPCKIVCDLHPDYLSTLYANETASEDAELIQVQHHHAHMASCMADNNLDGEVIGIIWDGVGYGTDGNSWGGEFLIGGYNDFSRAGSLMYMKLPGGDKATKELWRIGISLMIDAGLNPTSVFDEDKALMIEKQMQMSINCPLSSGMGRLFDGVAAIIGIKQQASYEGQGAILLEAQANVTTTDVYGFDIIESDRLELDWRPMIRELVSDKLSGAEQGYMAAKFMNTLDKAATEITVRIANEYGQHRVVLSGGTFNNMYMMNRLPRMLKAEGLEVYHHRRVSTGDEGLSLGQLMIASRR